jgi:signal transduction histidine kinase/ActR/RegA family two-component response regulator
MRVAEAHRAVDDREIDWEHFYRSPSDAAHERVGVPLVVRGEPHGLLTLVSCRGASIFGADGRVFAEELAQRIAVSIENAHLYEDLRRADRRKDEFLATLSHELRSPLNAIVGWTHMLRSGALDTTSSARALETIHRNAMVQSRLIADILDIQRLAAGKLRLNLAPIDLGVVIESAIDTVRPTAAARGIEIAAVLDPDVRAMLGDSERLQQIVWNFLSNAVKFTPAGGRVCVRLAGRETSIDIEVEDTGPGISAEFLPYIFERFRQADASSTRRHGGLGLGLSIARNLAELHGGSVSAANAPNGGAVLTVTLPRTLASANRVVAGPAPPGGTAEGASATSLHGTKVLLVDDELDGREIVAAVLGRAGAEVVVAGSAADGLGLLRREGADVVVCDIGMPDQDGYNFIRALRRRGVAADAMLPALALTAHAGSEDRDRALGAGFQVHLAKPVEPMELVATVARLAAESRRA